jgi:hypothetical protein
MTKKQISSTAQKVLNIIRSNEVCEQCRQTGKSLTTTRIILLVIVNEIVPNDPHPGDFQFWDDEADREWQNNQFLRNSILSLIDELENV